jgi:hypothetical protein
MLTGFKLLHGRGKFFQWRGRNVQEIRVVLLCGKKSLG